LVRRAVAVELEVTRELNKLLYSVESVYLGIVRDVVEYAVTNNVTNPTQLQRLFYSRYRQEYSSLNSQLVIQAIRQSSEIAKSFIEKKRRGLVDKPYPEVRSVSIRFTEKAWSYEQFIRSIAPVRLELSLLGERREVWLRPHKRFWLYWWRVLTGEAELASTLMLSVSLTSGMRSSSSRSSLGRLSHNQSFHSTLMRTLWLWVGLIYHLLWIRWLIGIGNTWFQNYTRLRPTSVG